MPNLYVEVETIKNAAVANEADNDDVWELLADGVSRLFDRECEVSDGFFNVAEVAVSTKSFRGKSTQYLKLSPYIPDSITSIDDAGTEYFEADESDRQYHEADGYLVFDFNLPTSAIIAVTARFGFAAIPSDIQMACIEQALFQWRKKDLAFADMSGVSAAAINAEFSPTFSAVTKRYREIYSLNTYFS